MAERTVLVCDTCGDPASQTITIRARGGNYLKDLCTAHVRELLRGARRPRRGRPRKSE